MPIARKMEQHAASFGSFTASNDEITDEHIADLEVRQHALAVAQELKDQCATKH